MLPRACSHGCAGACVRPGSTPAACVLCGADLQHSSTLVEGHGQPQLVLACCLPACRSLARPPPPVDMRPLLTPLPPPPPPLPQPGCALCEGAEARRAGGERPVVPAGQGRAGQRVPLAGADPRYRRGELTLPPRAAVRPSPAWFAGDCCEGQPAGLACPRSRTTVVGRSCSACTSPGTQPATPWPDLRAALPPSPPRPCVCRASRRTPASSACKLHQEPSVEQPACSAGWPQPSAATSTAGPQACSLLGPEALGQCVTRGRLSPLLP